MRKWLDVCRMNQENSFLTVNHASSAVKWGFSQFSFKYNSLFISMCSTCIHLYFFFLLIIHQRCCKLRCRCIAYRGANNQNAVFYPLLALSDNKIIISISQLRDVVINLLRFCVFIVGKRPAKNREICIEAEIWRANIGLRICRKNPAGLLPRRTASARIETAKLRIFSSSLPELRGPLQGARYEFCMWGVEADAGESTYIYVNSRNTRVDVKTMTMFPCFDESQVKEWKVKRTKSFPIWQDQQNVLHLKISVSPFIARFLFSSIAIFSICRKNVE